MWRTWSFAGSDLQLVAQVDHAEDQFHVGAIAAVEVLDDPVLEVGREPFIEPEVAPGGVGHEVAGPRVGQLVGDQRDEGTVAGQDRRGREGQAGVLHPAEREARGQDQDIVPAPSVGAEPLLDRADHRLDVREFVGGRLEYAGLGPDARAGAQRLEGQVAHRQGDEVGRDRLGHHEPEEALIGLVGPDARLGRHDRPEPLRDPDRPDIGDAHARRVLDWDPRPGMDRLRLGEQERPGLPRGERGLHPLEGTGRGRRPISDADLVRLGGQRDGELRTQHRVGRAEVIGRWGERLRDRRQLAEADLFDRQSAGIEDQGSFRRAPGLSIEIESRDPLDLATIEIHAQVEIDLPDPDLIRIAERMRVEPAGRLAAVAFRDQARRETRHRHAPADQDQCDQSEP